LKRSAKGNNTFTGRLQMIAYVTERERERKDIARLSKRNSVTLHTKRYRQMTKAALFTRSVSIIAQFN
jgi:hypothetical protein